MIGGKVLTDLRFADDIAMLAEGIDGLQSSETWTLKVVQQNRLRVFKMACLRRSNEKRQSQKYPQQTGITTRCHQQNAAKKTALLWTHLQNGKYKIPFDCNEGVGPVL